MQNRVCKTELKMGYVGVVWLVDGFQHVTLYLNIALGIFLVLI